MLPEKSIDRFLDDFLSGTSDGDVARDIAAHQEKANRKDADWTPPEGPVLVEAPAERRLSARTRLSIAIIALLIPATIWAGIVFLGDRKYLFVSLMIVVYTMIPFLMGFEGRKPQARELMVLAVLIAIGVAGRAAFFMLPQFKPVTAVVIITAVCFGPESGFLVGAGTAFVSNFFMGQGPWTPYQMFAWGIIGFLTGILFKKGRLPATKKSLCVYGFMVTFFIYGFILNTASPLMFYEGTLTLESLLPYYVSGAPFDLIHAVSTVFFLWLFAKPMIEKLERIKVKYGLLAPKAKEKVEE
jgi:energy-coupling factor transport system substrate-specific component